MKKLLLFILTSSLTFNALASKRTNQFEVTEQEDTKEVYLPSDVTMTIGEYSLEYFLKKPKHLIKVALLDKNFCAGIKKLAVSDKLFSKYPEHQTVFIYLRALFGIEKTFEDVCKELAIKDLSFLFDKTIIKLLDYLINIHNARTILKLDAQSYQRLINFETKLINHIAQLLPDNDAIGDVEKEQFKQFLNQDILDKYTIHENFDKMINKFSDILRLRDANKQGLLRLFYLSLIMKKYNERHDALTWKGTEFSTLLLKHFKDVTKTLEYTAFDPEIGANRLYERSAKDLLVSTALAYDPELFDVVIKNNIINNVFALKFYLNNEIRFGLSKKCMKEFMAFIVTKSSLEEIKEYLEEEITHTRTQTAPNKEPFSPYQTRATKRLSRKISLILGHAKPEKLKKILNYLKERYDQAKQDNDEMVTKLVARHIEPKSSSCTLL